ncbi:uncharacterized protein CLUP02_05505 [Colletotrichum lupini]|uniref:Uncharacterized protein n=1 Tax=Colletotrichum lupini TaxID=145971 RepID=A0A9Q8SMC4_9PEZI|nr:uncharacterized protein CLUP02_05505 [Colletotrichum lupini]UQC80024.1 hypothetical protein CLUP02_05505 [Colletotrichum lupini]
MVFSQSYEIAEFNFTAPIGFCPSPPLRAAFKLPQVHDVLTFRKQGGRKAIASGETVWCSVIATSQIQSQLKVATDFQLQNGSIGHITDSNFLAGLAEDTKDPFSMKHRLEDAAWQI